MSADNEQRKLVAIMFSDRVGCSALLQRDHKLALEVVWLATGNSMALVSRNGSEELVNCGPETCRAL